MTPTEMGLPLSERTAADEDERHALGREDTGEEQDDRHAGQSS